LSGLLFCAECGGRYVIQRHRKGVHHYGCAVHYDRGPAVCANAKLVQQAIIERKLLDHIFGDLFAPPRLAYLSAIVDEALEDGTRTAFATSTSRDAALREAQRELDNIANAIRQGIVTPTTKGLLEEAEGRVASLKAASREAAQRSAPVVSVQNSIQRYVADLRETLAGDVDEARRLLVKGFDRIVLRRDEDGRLWAEVRGNLGGLLNLEDAELVARVGAGSPFLTQPSTIIDCRIVA
jgi:hypothetical protein